MNDARLRKIFPGAVSTNWTITTGPIDEKGTLGIITNTGKRYIRPIHCADVYGKYADDPTPVFRVGANLVVFCDDPSRRNQVIKSRLFKVSAFDITPLHTIIPKINQR